MELLGLVTLVACATAAVPAAVPTSATKCERAPAHALPSDEHYRISVSGEPDLFLPGELYTVSLQGIDSGQGPTPFIGFTIWVEVKSEQPKIDKGANQSNETEAANLTLGTFQAYDAQAKIVEVCSPSVDNATAHPKTEVQVIWNAPSGTGVNTPEMCVRVCARVGPYPGVGAGGGGWSVLARELCSAPAAPHYSAKLPPIIEPCCACDEAKYEVTFESLWSRNTHPREFPPESAHAHFGDVIGASHTAQFRVWQEGRVASPGVRRLADDGTTVALEKELKAESDHIRTIIKARGISWQQVGGAGIPNTFAVFRVDAKHHLMSLAAKLAPSPDWIVGVSALELCNANCTWSRSATIPLYPYDAGTDNGVTYTSHRNPTIPATPVRALRPDWPRDARSPFYSTNGEMRPFARLRLTRLRLYEKSCDGTEGEPDRVQEHQSGQGNAASGGACAVHAWGQWGPCSVSCGPGRATRQRDYMFPTRAYAEACRVPLTDYRRCHGPRMHCRAPSEYEPDPAESTGPCAVSNWSEWSPCEGCGVRARVRHYVAPRAYKRCHIGYRARTIMSQAMPCEMGPCQKPPPKSNISAFDWFFVDTPRGDCHVSPWGSWSPCSAKCGRGRRLRTRLYVVHNSTVQAAMTRRLFEIWSKRFMELQSLPYTPHENTTAEDPEIETKVQEFIDRCQFTLTQQEALCDGDDISCLNNTVPLEVCKQPLSVGHCRGYEERWFYEWAKKTCEPFGFSGCGGNGNNFRTRDHCLRACVTRVNITAVNVTTVANESMTALKKLKPTPPHEDNEVLQNDGPPLYDATPSNNSNQASINQNRQRPLGKQQLANLLQDVLTPAEEFPPTNNDNGPKKRPIRPINKRAHSVSPVAPRPRSPPKKPADRRCQSLSPCTLAKKKSQEQVPPTSASVTDGLTQPYQVVAENDGDKDLVMPQCVITKVMRILSTKKREFLKLRKNLISQQNSLLENYAQLKDLELRAGVPHTDDTLGEVRIISVSNWPAHDLLMLVRDDLELPVHSEISGIFGPHVLQQITAQLNPIPEEMLAVSAEIMARRIELLNVLRGKHRNDRATYLTNLEWKTKNSEFDNETEKLHRLVAGTAENLKAKINYSLELAKIPWVDRELMTKKIERLHKENMILQHKIEEYTKKDPDDTKELGQIDNIPNQQTLCEELAKERAAREALKEVVSAAESMLRVARARIATLERQLKETRAELEAARKKHKDLEQLYRHRETSYDARSKKLLEVSKTGEITIETLSRQRDALEIRVKELREQAEQAEKSAAAKEAEQRARAESLQAKVAEQEKIKAATENRVVELDAKVKELEDQLQALRERSVRLVDMERRRCLEYVPLKENEPSDRETEIWKELQVTRVALSKVEEELRQSRADKDNFLNSLSRIAQGEGADSVQEKIATELLDREQKIAKLQHVIEEQRENEKLMEQSMTQYENQLAALRLEVKRLRNYDGYAKEVPHQELHTELLELHMQVETLSRERTALVTAAASRALMLERHERAADLFARMIRARRDLSSLLDGRTDPPTLDDTAHTEVSRSLSSVCTTAADTWTALRAERARVLRLESAVLAQSLQLEREGRVRTQLERRRAILEREIMRSTLDGSADLSVLNPIKNPNLGHSWT